MLPQDPLGAFLSRNTREGRGVLAGQMRGTLDPTLARMCDAKL
jgi:hypothetical protein